jgi:hypothetical protein
MLPRQLSFWDNEALEKGYRCLDTLELSEAAIYFKEALVTAISEMDCQQLITACEYWQPRIEYSSADGGNRQEKISALLADYRHFSFSRQMDHFKKALLTHTVNLFFKQAGIDLNNLEVAFDLLIEAGDFQKAEELASFPISQHPDPQLLYMLAQAQWLDHKRTEANNNYVMLLLCYPQKTILKRIENKKLCELVVEYGAAFAPVYGWLRNVVPYFLPPEKVEIYDDDHRKALECYCLIRDANKALGKNDTNSSTLYRKKLKLLMPSLFHEYFNWLQRNKL